jgi:hypothetical protein
MESNRARREKEKNDKKKEELEDIRRILNEEKDLKKQYEQEKSDLKNKFTKKKNLSHIQITNQNQDEDSIVVEEDITN